jgi:hypothetical protein
MHRRSKWVVNCWLGAGLLLSSVALYWLAVWLLPPGNPRNSTLGRAYDQIDSRTTLAAVQAIVGRPPDSSQEPPGITFVQALYFFPLPDCDTATWRDLDKSLVVYYSTERDKKVVGKGFYVDRDLSQYDGTAGWRRLTKWFHKIFR